MAETKNKPEIFEMLLQEERQRNVCYLNRARFAGVALFLALQIGVIYLLPSPAKPFFPWALWGYCMVSGILFAGACHSDQVARWSALAVPFFDMPAVFVVQWLDFPFSTNVRALADFTLSLFVLLVLLSALMLKTRQVVLAAGVAAGLELWLQSIAGTPLIGRVASVAVLGAAVMLCRFVLGRRIEMAQVLADEVVRRERLSRYFSPQVAANIEQTSLGLAVGRQCEATVLFADMHRFTSLCERLTPAETVALLNEFQTCMVEAVFAHDGTLDKFLGDGLMAYFGAPLERAEHPLLAVRCALGMQKALADLNAARVGRGQAPLRLGVGVHTGPVVVGAIGTANRREFTAVGDTVNVASRLENLTRKYGADILLSGETARHIADAIPLRVVDETTVRGRSQSIRVFTPVCG